MTLDTEIVVVSGLPRSGTSLMMQMLSQGGLPVLTDEIRTADTDNPRGYFEFERVKRTKQDPGWLPDARGKVVKLVSSLLYDLPATESYRVLFMQRDIEEVLASQEAMLKRAGRSAVPRDQMRGSFALHLERLFEWLPAQHHMRVLTVNYNNLLGNPETEVGEISEFLEHQARADRMLDAIDTSLYRNRRATECQKGS